MGPLSDSALLLLNIDIPIFSSTGVDDKFNSVHILDYGHHKMTS